MGTHTTKIPKSIQQLSQFDIGFRMRFDGFFAQDQVLWDGHQRFFSAPREGSFGDDARTTIFETRDGTNFDAIECNAMECSPCWQGAYGAFKPAL